MAATPVKKSHGTRGCPGMCKVLPSLFRRRISAATVAPVLRLRVKPIQVRSASKVALHSKTRASPACRAMAVRGGPDATARRRGR